jgi:hypothetical protein
MQGDMNKLLQGSIGLLGLGLGAKYSSPGVIVSESAQISAKSSEVSSEYLYRGVSANHPTIDLARQGIVVPGNVDGVVTEAAHNYGGVAADSPFTSWSRSLDVALDHALKEGPDGVVLVAPVGAPPPGSSWSWALSPDRYFESEVLMRGIRTGLEVIKP